VIALSTGRVGTAVEQTVEAIVPPGEQQVEPIAPRQDQAVDGVQRTGEQAVAPLEPPSPAAKAASTAGKVVTGVAAAAVSLGAMAAMLLFI
jgi:hypothetical protein